MCARAFVGPRKHSGSPARSSHLIRHPLMWRSARPTSIHAYAVPARHAARHLAWPLGRAFPVGQWSRIRLEGMRCRAADIWPGGGPLVCRRGPSEQRPRRCAVVAGGRCCVGAGCIFAGGCCGVAGRTLAGGRCVVAGGCEVIVADGWCVFAGGGVVVAVAGSCLVVADGCCVGAVLGSVGLSHVRQLCLRLK